MHFSLQQEINLLFYFSMLDTDIQVNSTHKLNINRGKEQSQESSYMYTACLGSNTYCNYYSFHISLSKAFW